MYDAHTHLNTPPLYTSRQNHISNFENAWGKWLVNIWMDDLHNKQAIEICSRSKKSHPNIFIWATIWLHPCEVSFWKISSHKDVEREIKKLRKLYKDQSLYICGIGECWIDSYHTRNTEIEEIQTVLFEKQCILARELQLPLIVHSRSNFSLTKKILSNYTDLDIYLHCRWYWPDEIQISLDTFPSLWIWFCWNVTYPKAINIQESFSYMIDYLLPDWNKNHHLLLETDAPYLSPQNVRSKKNCPEFIIHLYQRVQERYPESDIRDMTENAFRKLYKNI